MDTRIMEYFLVVAKTQNITKAANELNVTQPTLSRQIQQLEEELGVELFSREKQRIVLTENGILFRQRALEITDLLDKTKKELESPKKELSGDIYIGAGEMESMEYLMKLVAEFRSRYPKVCFHIFSGNADAISDKIDKGLIDFGMVMEPASIEKYESIKMNCHNHWGIQMPITSTLAQKSSIVPGDLTKIPLILSSRNSVSSLLAKWNGTPEESLNIVGTFDLFYNSAVMVKAGIGYSVSLSGLLKNSGISGLCFRPLEPAIETCSVIVWKKYQLYSPTTTKFLEYLKENII
jgi:DNA-binding transcriptional LysR family regulator